MLKYLHIENIAVIERSDIEFFNGLNVLTGETGAGKSILIDAINAVLGERTSKDLIRAGCEKAIVSALFTDISDTNLKKIADYAVVPDQDGNILITRILNINGKGSIKINGLPFTATLLKEISVFLIDIHGQHDNQSLLKPEKHCGFIDAVAENQTFIENYYAEFKKLNLIRKSLKELEIDDEQKERKIELLKYQIKEIEDASIRLGEFQELIDKLKIAENLETVTMALNSAKILLNGDEDSDGALIKLKNSLKELYKINNNELTDKLGNALSLCEDVNALILRKLQDDEFLGLNIDEINLRLDYLQKLMLKYGNSEENILKFAENATQELNNITYADEKINQLSIELEASKQRLINLGAQLTETRTKAAESFKNDVCRVLNYLNMPDVIFYANIEQGRYTKNGCDTVEFMISANSGEEPKPLNKIASGGELSRIMLAIKSSLSDKDSVDTMIFDEIDTGISGFAADKVGAQLKRVSNSKQVICVTHLAQIAVAADNHLLIEKSVKEGRTFTEVTQLDPEQRITEIARIMSGSEITENLYNSAKELLDRSLKNENL